MSDKRGLIFGALGALLVAWALSMPGMATPGLAATTIGGAPGTSGPVPLGNCFPSSIQVGEGTLICPSAQDPTPRPLSHGGDGQVTIPGSLPPAGPAPVCSVTQPDTTQKWVQVPPPPPPPLLPGQPPPEAPIYPTPTQVLNAEARQISGELDQSTLVPLDEFASQEAQQLAQLETATPGQVLQVIRALGQANATMRAALQRYLGQHGTWGLFTTGTMPVSPTTLVGDVLLPGGLSFTGAPCASASPYVCSSSETSQYIGGPQHIVLHRQKLLIGGDNQFALFYATPQGNGSGDVTIQVLPGQVTTCGYPNGTVTVYYTWTTQHRTHPSGYPPSLITMAQALVRVQPGCLLVSPGRGLQGQCPAPLRSETPDWVAVSTPSTVTCSGCQGDVAYVNQPVIFGLDGTRYSYTATCDATRFTSSCGSTEPPTHAGYDVHVTLHETVAQIAYRVSYHLFDQPTHHVTISCPWTADPFEAGLGAMSSGNPLFVDASNGGQVLSGCTGLPSSQVYGIPTVSLPTGTPWLALPSAGEVTKIEAQEQLRYVATETLSTPTPQLQCGGDPQLVVSCTYQQVGYVPTVALTPTHSPHQVVPLFVAYVNLPVDTEQSVMSS